MVPLPFARAAMVFGAAAHGVARGGPRDGAGRPRAHAAGSHRARPIGWWARDVPAVHAGVRRGRHRLRAGRGGPPASCAVFRSTCASVWACARTSRRPPRADGSTRCRWARRSPRRRCVEGLRRRWPALPLVVSTVTETGARVVRERFAGLASHRYLPLDFPGAARRVVASIRPAFFVGMETELWPNLLRTLAARGVPAMVANGRLSDRSFRRYRLVRGAMRRVLADVSVFGMQSDEDARRMIALGAPPERVVVTGNMKHEAPPDPAGAADLWRRLARSGAAAARVDRRQHAPRRGGRGPRGPRGRPRDAARPGAGRRAAPPRAGRRGVSLVTARGLGRGAAQRAAGRRAGCGARDRARHGGRAGAALLDRRRGVRGRQPGAVRWPQHARAGRARQARALRAAHDELPRRRRAAARQRGRAVSCTTAAISGSSCSGSWTIPMLRATSGDKAHAAVAARHGAVGLTLELVERYLYPETRGVSCATAAAATAGSAASAPGPTRCSPRWPAAIAGCSARANGCTRAGCWPRARSTSRWSRSAI